MSSTLSNIENNPRLERRPPVMGRGRGMTAGYGVVVPPLDAFGTRLELEELRAGLDGIGVPALRLEIRDSDLLLEVAGADIGSDEVSRAVTWLRSMFSPLIPVELEKKDLLDQIGTVVVDGRMSVRSVIVLSEVNNPALQLTDALHDLLDRLGVERPFPAASGRPGIPEASLKENLYEMVARWSVCLGERGIDPDTCSLTYLRADGKLTPVLRSRGEGGIHLLAWSRPGGSTGVRPGLILGAAYEEATLDWLRVALNAPSEALPSRDVLLDGLTWGVARRPTIAVPPGSTSGSPIWVDEERCTDCGVCAALCPTDFLDESGRARSNNPADCIRCYDCVDGCPEDALRPVYSADTAMRGELPSIGEGWLARLRGAPGPQEPALFPPSYLLPKEETGPPRIVLGLAIIPQQEHAAALVIDGKLVGAIEEEKLARVRHYGWKPRNGPGFRNLGVDPTLTVEQVLCRRSIRVLLAENGLTLDDVDLIALNGLLSRYRRALPVLDDTRSIPILQSGRVMCVPHHLCHAASAYRLSGLEAAWVFTVDGRGDRETAALFRAEGDQITLVKTLLSLTDRSVGGVYETLTRLLGFGGHGQGSVMALAAFGQQSYDLKPYLSADSWSEQSVHEGGLQDVFRCLSRSPDMPILQSHKDLAASLQAALEKTLTTLVETGVDGDVDALCLAGGVALNCRLNNLMRTTFRPASIWVQPGANDAGTAVGAAAEAWAQRVGGNLEEMVYPGVGPSFSPERIELALRRAGVSYTRVDDIAEVTAELLADGEVVCWFQGRLEFGPRALGARSIIADPRRKDMQDKVNRIKTRESWRPFGPSILEGHQDDWFVDAFDSRFMLFTLEVQENKRALVPAVVHVDGTSRPQVVHVEHQPAYHRMISSFYTRTGVPLVLNTSFNRRGEPIVCTPTDALEAFPELGADVLAIGPFVVRRGERVSEHPDRVSVTDTELNSLPGGRRLSLRMTTRCDLECAHCTLRDHSGHGEANASELELALVNGRRAGCDELVVMRGEATLRPDLPGLLKRARSMGYHFIQLQTHGCALASPGYLKNLHGVVDSYELMLLGYEPALHDRLAGRTGAFRKVLKAAQLILKMGARVWMTIPVLRQNAAHIPRMVALASKLGLSRVQLAFPRPVELVDCVPNEELLRLSDAARAVNRTVSYAERVAVTISTEGFPLCLLDASLHGTPDAVEDFSRHRIDDLGQVHDEFDRVREAMRPVAAPCRGCDLRDSCPKTWGLYLEMFGTGELNPVAK